MVIRASGHAGSGEIGRTQARRDDEVILQKAANPADLALLIDFDNTITLGDVLNGVIERYSSNDTWRTSQSDWEAGRISTLECLRQQIEGLVVDETTLLADVQRAAVDPGFARLLTWTAATGTPLAITSDNFEPLIRAILASHQLAAPRIFANSLAFDGRRLRPAFPHRSGDCPRCANCKSLHLRHYAGRRIVYVGDGLSDLCPALRADVVFAKDALAAELRRRSVPFTPWANLDQVADALAAMVDPLSPATGRTPGRARR